jgi:cytochrome c
MELAMKSYVRSFLMGFVIATIGLAVVSVGHAAVPGDAGRGAKIYEQKCTGCHSIETNRIGPAHRGVFGRKAGSAPGFSYSPGLKSSKIIWTEPTLNRWLTNPQGTIPGARMGFRLADAVLRADVIAFLKTQTAKKK